MTEEAKEYVKNLLIKANEDIAILELSSEHPENYTSAICFHSQQAVEKFFKSYLAYKEIEFERKHDVDFLLSQCMKVEKSQFEYLDLKSLNDYTVKVRYADDFYYPSVKEALEYKEIAFEVKKIVDGKIKF